MRGKSLFLVVAVSATTSTTMAQTDTTKITALEEVVVSANKFQEKRRISRKPSRSLPPKP